MYLERESEPSQLERERRTRRANARTEMPRLGLGDHKRLPRRARLDVGFTMPNLLSCNNEACHKRLRTGWWIADDCLKKGAPER